MTGLRGRWAQGLEPRAFFWLVKDRLAGSERPGGFARNHRKVRRSEEIIWLRSHGFTQVLSLLDGPHNLHAYEEAGIDSMQIALGRGDELLASLAAIYAQLAAWMGDPEQRVLVHHEECGDRLIGTLAGYLLYAGPVDAGPHAIQILEKLTGRELGAEGREIVAATIDAGLKHAS
ncbi:MAG: hypothetical protein ACOYNI_07980 [Acidimicrobiia bacterium]